MMDKHDLAVRALAMLDVAVNALHDCELAIIGAYGNLSDDSRAVRDSLDSAERIRTRITSLIRRASA